MSQRTRLFAAGIAMMLSLTLVERSSFAQSWLRDRRYAEGAGIRLGDFELHPGIAGEVGYDSNWFLRSSKNNVSNGSPNAPVEGAGVFRITPQLSIATLGQQRKDGAEGASSSPSVTFRLNAAATYREFIGSALLNDQRNLSVNADARVDIFPKRPFSLGLTAGYVRMIRPTTLGNPDISFNTSNPFFGVDATVTPNNGTFDASLGYSLNAILFEQQAGSPFSNTRHEIALRERWRFRPRTALFHESTLGVITYNAPGQALNVLTDSVPIRTRLGVNGLVGPRIAILAAAGMGGTFLSLSSPTTRQFDSFIAQAEVRFYPTETSDTTDPGKLSLTQSSLALGYTRDFEANYFGNFNGVDKGYANLSYFFGGRVLVSVNAGLSALHYPEVFATTRATALTAPFSTLRAEASVYGEYRFSDTFALNATFQYNQSITDKQVEYSPGSIFDLSWSRLQAFAGARWFL